MFSKCNLTEKESSLRGKEGDGEAGLGIDMGWPRGYFLTPLWLERSTYHWASVRIRSGSAPGCWIGCRPQCAGCAAWW